MEVGRWTLGRGLKVDACVLGQISNQVAKAVENLHIQNVHFASGTLRCHASQFVS